MSSVVASGLRLIAALTAALPFAAASAQTVEATRILGTPPRLDGRLTEDVWSSAQPLSGLLQRDPVEGAPATERTEVRFAYDDDALWIGARMFSTSASAIRALVTRAVEVGIAAALTAVATAYFGTRAVYKGIVKSRQTELRGLIARLAEEARQSIAEPSDERKRPVLPRR